MFTEENQCLVTMEEMANLRQLGDNFIDKATCRSHEGCYTSDRRPHCYYSIGIPQSQT